MADSWITSPLSAWTTRDGDQWVGGLSWQMPEALTVDVSVLPAVASHTTVVDVPLLAISTQMFETGVSLLTSVQVDTLSVSLDLKQAETVINTQVNVPVVDELDIFILPAQGVRAEIAFASLIQATFTPKNPIVESDVTLSPAAMSMSFDMQDGLYGSLAYINTDLIDTLDLSLLNANAYADISLFPSSLSMGVSINESVVDFDYTVLPFAYDLNITVGAHYVQVVPVITVSTVQMQTQMLEPDVFAGVEVNPSCLSLTSSLNTASLSYDYQQDTEAIETEMVVLEAVAEVDHTSEPDLLTMSTTLLEPANIQFAPLLTVTTALNSSEVFHDYQVDAGGAFSMEINHFPPTYRIDFQQNVSTLQLSAIPVEIVYASEMIREWEVFDTSITREIELSGKIDARGRMNE